LRLAIAGLGGAARRGHLPALTGLGDAVKLVAAADRDPGRRASIAPSLDGVEMFASAEEMLAQIDADVLVVATEPYAHANLATAAMERGLHVVCEKPLALARGDHDAIAALCADRPDLALVPVHQYRYSPPWASIRRWGRCAARLGRQYRLTVDLRRAGTDRHAASAWRADRERSGGILADAGVHFIALAWTLDERLEPMAATRCDDNGGGERSAMQLRMGSGLFRFQAWNGAPERYTGLELKVEGVTIAWRDGLATLECGGRRLLGRRVPALSDRNHVDALYAPLYRDLVTNLACHGWRRRRTAEALGVGEALISLLERAPIDTAPASR
jgi:predicted dehydrogenase